MEGARSSPVCLPSVASDVGSRIVLGKWGIVLVPVGTCSSLSWPWIVINDGSPLGKPTGPSMRIAPFFGGAVVVLSSLLVSSSLRPNRSSLMTP